MSLHLTSNPSVLDKTGVATLREAVRLAAKAAGTTNEEERQHLASIVLSFYRRGLMDPKRLAENRSPRLQFPALRKSVLYGGLRPTLRRPC